MSAVTERLCFGRRGDVRHQDCAAFGLLRVVRDCWSLCVVCDDTRLCTRGIGAAVTVGEAIADGAVVEDTAVDVCWWSDVVIVSDGSFDAATLAVNARRCFRTA